MEILDQLGMLQRFLARRMTAGRAPSCAIAGRDWTIGDLSPRHAGAVHRHDAAMGPPRFPARRGKAFPGFQLEMNAPVAASSRTGEGRRRDARRRARGARALTIAADGRGLIVRGTPSRLRISVRPWTCCGSELPKKRVLAVACAAILRRDGYS